MKRVYEGKTWKRHDGASDREFLARRNHYEMHRITSRLGGGLERNPFMRACRVGDFWQTRFWDVELGAPLGDDHA